MVDTVQTATCPGRTAPDDCPHTRVVVTELDELELGAPVLRQTVLAGCIECEGACFIIARR